MWLRRTWELVPAHVEHLQIAQLAEPRRQLSCAETRLKNCACGMPGQTARRTIEAHLAQIERCQLRKSNDIRRDGATEPVVAELELLERWSERCEQPQSLRKRWTWARNALLNSLRRGMSETSSTGALARFDRAH